MHDVWALPPQQLQPPCNPPEARQDTPRTDPVQSFLGDRQAELADWRTVNDRTAVTRYHGDTVAVTALGLFKAENRGRISPSRLRVTLRHMQDVQSVRHAVVISMIPSIAWLTSRS